jgi:hypothetical protein
MDHMHQMLLAQLLGGWLSTWQLIAIVVLIVLIIIWVVLRKKQ